MEFRKQVAGIMATGTRMTALRILPRVSSILVIIELYVTKGCLLLLGFECLFSLIGSIAPLHVGCTHFCTVAGMVHCLLACLLEELLEMQLQNKGKTTNTWCV